MASSVPSKDPNACAERLIALVHLLLRTRPMVLFELERSASEIVTTDVRQQIAERLRRFSTQDVGIVEALTDYLDQRRANCGDGLVRPSTSEDERQPPGSEGT